MTRLLHTMWVRFPGRVDSDEVVIVNCRDGVALARPVELTRTYGPEVGPVQVAPQNPRRAELLTSGYTVVETL